MPPTSFIPPENNLDSAADNADGAMGSLAESNAAFDNSFLHVAPAHTSFAKKHSYAILATGIVVSLLLVTAGVLKQVWYQAIDEHGRDEASIQQEIDAVDEELAKLEKASDDAFESSGFSGSFYQASQSQANLMLDKTDLEYSLAAVSEKNSSANLFNTGAIYFFLAGLVCGLVTITVFLAARRRPKSASIVG